MVTKTLYTGQQKRHRCKEQTSGLWEKMRMGWVQRIALKHVYEKCLYMKHVYDHMWNRWPMQFSCMLQGPQGWCTGMILRDGMGREVGAGFRTGNTCTPNTKFVSVMTSLVVHWLRLHSQCRGPGLIPGQGTKSHMPQLNSMPQLKVPHAANKDPTCHN